jgi:hypothetical protein
METYLFSIVTFLLSDARIRPTTFTGAVEAADYGDACQAAWQAINDEIARYKSAGYRIGGTAEFRIDKQEEPQEGTTQPMADQLRIETNDALLTISHTDQDAKSALTIALNTDAIVLDAGQALELADFLYQRSATLYRQAHDLTEQE